MFDDGLVRETIEQLNETAMKAADAPLWSMSDADVLAGLDLAHRTMQAVAALTMHLVREADGRGLPAAEHAHTTGRWLGCRLRVRPSTGRQMAELSRGLERRPALDEALIAGAVNVEQAAVIHACVDTLPAEVGADDVDLAESMLIGHARDFDATGLKHLADRILFYVAPEIAEAAEAQALAREEATAHEGRFLSLSSPVNGRVRLKGSLGVEAAAIVEAALDPLCAPRTSHYTLDVDASPRDAAAGGDRAVVDTRRPEQRRADALVEVCGLVLTTGDLPTYGGEPAQLSVTVGFDAVRDDLHAVMPDLATSLILGDPPTHASQGAGRSGMRRQLGVGTLTNGARITPASVRRIACDARILPAVLGADGQVLDVGRTKRLFEGPLRRALVLRDGGCAFPGCTRPQRWTEGHHIVSWSDGGGTDVDNGVLVCREHHRAVHHTDWVVRLAADGLSEFIPPAYLDRHQRPRRNAYHRRV